MAKIRHIKSKIKKNHFRIIGRDTKLAKRIAKKRNIKRPKQYELGKYKELK